MTQDSIFSSSPVATNALEAKLDTTSSDSVRIASNDPVLKASASSNDSVPADPEASAFVASVLATSTAADGSLLKLDPNLSSLPVPLTPVKMEKKSSPEPKNDTGKEVDYNSFPSSPLEEQAATISPPQRATSSISEQTTSPCSEPNAPSPMQRTLSQREVLAAAIEQRLSPKRLSNVATEPAAQSS